MSNLAALFHQRQISRRYSVADSDSTVSSQDAEERVKQFASSKSSILTPRTTSTALSDDPPIFKFEAHTDVNINLYDYLLEKG